MLGSGRVPARCLACFAKGSLRGPSEDAGPAPERCSCGLPPSTDVPLRRRSDAKQLRRPEVPAAGPGTPFRPRSLRSQGEFGHTGAGAVTASRAEGQSLYSWAILRQSDNISHHSLWLSLSLFLSFCFSLSLSSLSLSLALLCVCLFTCAHTHTTFECEPVSRVK